MVRTGSQFRRMAAPCARSNPSSVLSVRNRAAYKLAPILELKINMPQNLEVNPSPVHKGRLRLALGSSHETSGAVVGSKTKAPAPAKTYGFSRAIVAGKLTTSAPVAWWILDCTLDAPYSRDSAACSEHFHSSRQ
jgi:hypothetical protein